MPGDSLEQNHQLPAVDALLRVGSRGDVVLDARVRGLGLVFGHRDSVIRVVDLGMPNQGLLRQVEQPAAEPVRCRYSLRAFGAMVSPATSTLGMPGAAGTQSVVPATRRNTPKSVAA